MIMRVLSQQKTRGVILSLGVGLSILILTVSFFMRAETAYALPVDPTDISYIVRGASTFYMDSNSFCNAAAGPDGMWLPIEITNNHATDTATGLEVEFEPPTNSTSDDTIRYIGNLGPGDMVNIFFFVDYSALRADPNCTTLTNQDHWYSEDYTVTLRSIDGTGSLTGDAVFDTDTFDTFRMISAQAGGVRTSDVIGPGATVGQVLTQSVVYDFGNNNGNNDLFFQPTGNGSTFRDDCFRLIGSEITRSDVTGITVGDTDQLFFTNLGTNNGQQVEIVYQWLVLCSPGTSTQTFAWAEMTSGTQFKYAGGADYGPTDFPLPNPVTGQVSIHKLVQVPSNFLFGVDDPVIVTYTVEVANAYTLPVILSSVADQLDSNMAFVDETTTSDIDSTNSTISPAASDTGLLDWFGLPPDNSYIIPAQSSINLIYQVSIDYDSLEMNPQIFTNTVTTTVGSEVLGPVNTTVTITPGSILSVGLNTVTANGRIGPSAWYLASFALLGLATRVVYLRYRKHQIV